MLSLPFLIMLCHSPSLLVLVVLSFRVLVSCIFIKEVYNCIPLPWIS